MDEWILRERIRISATCPFCLSFFGRKFQELVVSDRLEMMGRQVKRAEATKNWPHRQIHWGIQMSTFKLDFLRKGIARRKSGSCTWHFMHQVWFEQVFMVLEMKMMCFQG